MCAAAIQATLEPEENGKLVYLEAVPKAADQPGTSLLAFQVTMENTGDVGERLTQISVVLVPRAGQPGNPAPVLVTFPRNTFIGAETTTATQIKEGEDIFIPPFLVSRVQISLTFERHDQVVLQRAIAPHRSPTPHGSFRFFAHTRDMDFDEYFVQSRHKNQSQYFEYDMKVKGWNEDAGDLSLIRSGTAGTRNEDYFGYGKPLYAMGDGTVISFDNDYQENPVPGLRALARLTDDDAGLISALSLTRLSNDRVVTAVRTFEGTLKLIAWRIVHEGRVQDVELARMGEVDGEPTTDVALAALSPSRLVTALRTEAGTLKVAAWDISGDGMTISARGADEAGTVGDMAIAGLSETRVAVAVKTAEGNLKLIAWDVSADGLSVTRVGEATAGAIQKVALVALSDERLVTAVRTGAGKLKVIVWDIAADGAITRRGDAEAGTISDVSVTRVKSAVARLVTAVVTGGKLKSIAWEIDADGNVERTGDLVGGAASGVAADAAYIETDDYTTCTIAEDGTLTVNTWKSADDKKQEITELLRYSEDSAGKVSLADVAWLEFHDLHFIVTAVKTESGQLKLIVWWLSSKSGNHLRILHGDEVVAFFHLKQGSLNPDLCEVGAPVTEGQFLGQLGNSGSSGSPHCHIESRKVLGGMSVEAIIAAHEAGDLDGSLSYRPMPFHNAQTMHRASVEHGVLADNRFGVADRQGFYWVERAIWPGLTTPGIPTGRAELAFLAVKSADCQRLLEKITGAGYELVWIDGYSVGTDLRFNLLFRPEDGRSWFARHSLSAAAYQTEFEEQKRRGRRLVCVNSFRSGSSTRYAAIFREANGASPVAYHALSQSQHDAKFDELTSDGFVPVNLSVVSVDGQLRYTAFYEQRNVGTVVVESFLTPNGYQQAFEAQENAGLEIAYLDAYQHDGGVRFSAIWSGEHDGPTRARHQLTEGGYQQEYETLTEQGFSTAMIVGYSHQNQHTFAGVWRK